MYACKNSKPEGLEENMRLELLKADPKLLCYVVIFYVLTC